jgi:sterol 14-demethylase
MGIVFAGVINTGMNSCWTLIHLGSNPSWKQRAIDECKALVANHTNTLSSDPLHKRLSAIPLDAWENELPALDLIIRETLRMTLVGSALRRNVHQDITVDDVIIKRGEFMTYQIADTHMNPDIYTEPTRFDPDRYLEGREEDRKETFAYIGWGVGRHPCAGMKIAKLEIKLVLAFVLLGFEYELVDGSGKYPKALPVPDRNDLQQARPLGDPCYLKFKRVME